MKPATLLAAGLVLLLAAFLRFHQLEAQSFWNDEGNSARLSERPIAQIIEGTASDVHPPLYYLMLHGWRAGAGSSEFGLRAFSALAGVLTVAVTMGLARLLLRSPDAVMLVAGVLAAVSPPLVYYSQETRMYAMLALLAVLSTWVLLQWMRRSGSVQPGQTAWPWLLVYALLIAAGLYTHYFFPAIVIAHALVTGLTIVGSRQVVSSARRWRPLGTWAAAVALAVLAYAVWLPIFLRQIGGRAGASQSLAAYLADSGVWLGVGTTLPLPATIWPLVAGLLLVLLGIVSGRRHAMIPLVMAAVPIGGSYLAGATDPAFFKFLLTSVPFLCILGGLAWRLTGWSRSVPLVLTAVVIAGNGLSLANMVNDPAYARADYRAMAAQIAADAHPSAAVILNAPNQWEVFTYYHRDGAPVFPLPRGQADPAIVEPELAAIAAAHDRLYVLFWGDAQRDPQRVVERWLDANAFKTAESWVGDVRFVTYAAPDSAMSELTPVDYRFQLPEGEIVLSGYAAQPQEAHPGDIVQVRLAWSTAEPIAQPYKVFVHLSDAIGVPIAQHDSEPAGGSRPTTGWQPGEVIMDNHGLLVPEGTPPGIYQITVGLYDPADPSVRLPVMVNGDLLDAVPLAAITVP